ncbi:putative F-box protein At3g23950 [Cynara cardunculus var. scolymus]|uniref:F-box associated interaction domain-containing protein n=1 Tax=Cynara cardunculus var. scolymus TaxID=59895 RepID=A0A103Y075_CYNCS|nr:putative F-box protein At3g23950 [Cynara cardunculus var. scolymus]KVI00097.1 F-box associated interaction domain-containing protein [Cynara cardunculus var. scolymus]
MDGGKNPGKFFGTRNNKIYMDLKLIIREHALQFLPAKSLFKFRGVCRDWKLMISTPFFAHNQSLSFSSVSGLFLQTSGGQPTFISLDPEACGVPDPSLKFLPVPVDIVASSNGLLCCQAQTGDKAYYICNPATMQWKKLPKPTMEHGHEPAVVLIFKPSLLNFVAEYKLICGFRSVDMDDATEFEIYSSKDESWKVSGEMNYAAKKLIPKSGVSINDVAYWQTCYGGILAFDLTKDRSQLIHGCHSTNGTLGEMNGKLCTAFTFGHTLTVSVISNIYSNTMQMSSQARLWDDKVRVPLSNEVLDGNLYDQFPVLYAGSEAVFLFSGQCIYRVDLKTKEVKFVVEASRFDRRAIPYVNSLVAL